MVKAGEILLRLDSTSLKSELIIAEGQLFELMARRGRLEAERDNQTQINFDVELLQTAKTSSDIDVLLQGQERLFNARLDTLKQEIEQMQKRGGQISDQITGIVAQQAALNSQVNLIKQELESQQSLLDKGLTQISRVLGLQREQAKLQGQMGALIASKAQAEGRITEINIEVLKFDTKRREDAITRLRDLQYRELELQEKRKLIRERLSRLDIRASVSGIVYGLQFFATSAVVRPAETILFLVPQDRPLVIAAKIQTTNRDQVFIGQNVTLRFSAFDARTTPELQGRVVKVSADAFIDERSQISFYRSEITLLNGELDKLPESTTLIPGMPVQAFIRTQDRTPLAYLLKPFTDYFAKAFRE